MIRKALGFLVLFLIAVGGAWGWFAWRAMQKPLNLPAEGLVFQLESGASLRALSRQLAARGVVENPWYVEIQGRWLTPGGAIRAGEYLLEPPMTIAELLQKLRQGKALQHRFTVVEGVTFGDFARQLRTLVKKGRIRGVIEDGQYAAAFRKLTGQPHEEGWIFPDTYQYARGDTDRTLMLAAYHKMKATLDANWASRQKDLPLKTPYEALILASIVEKETGVASERPIIAGVFIRRLRLGMKLQTDPTVVYGMGERYHGNIHKADLKRDTPYNTYTRKGLPPTPIALPGAGAIAAVTHPNDTGALFFVAKGGGRHHFSKTYKEHRAAVIKYLLGGKAKRYKGDS